MNVLTVTREYGAGGYDVARRLAKSLGWELLDRQLLHEAAALENLPDEELEALDEKAISLADRFRLHPPHHRYIQGLRKAARKAAARGNVVLVGRGTGQLLFDLPNVLHVRLVADRQWRAGRIAQKEGWTAEQAMARCAEEDRTRDRFTRYFFGEAPFHAAAYDVVFQTGWMPLESVVAAVVALVRGEWPYTASTAPSQRRVLTLSRELGAGDTGFAPTLGGRLGLRVYDRKLLEQQATRLGVTEQELVNIDDHSASLFERFRPGSLHQRYWQALEQLMRELAAQGNVIVVGRGGSRFLRDYPRAFHLRLVASSEDRVRRIMEHRWVRQGPARQLIAESDARRRQFYESLFGADWSNPLEYHLTVNSGRLGPAAVDVAAFAAERYWEETP